MPDVVWDGIKYLSNPKLPTVQQLKFGKGYVISCHILMGLWSLIHAGVKVNLC